MCLHCNFETSWCTDMMCWPRLVGCPPFWHRKQLIMVRMIMEGKYSFASPEWDDISENAKDLVRRQHLKLFRIVVYCYYTDCLVKFIVISYLYQLANCALSNLYPWLNRNPELNSWVRVGMVEVYMMWLFANRLPSYLWWLLRTVSQHSRLWIIHFSREKRYVCAFM